MTDGEPVRAVGYVRVSTEEQKQSGLGMEAQREAIVSETGRRGWELAGVFEDAGYSGKDLRRPGVQAVLAALDSRDPGSPTMLVAARLDRLSRSALDFATLLQRAQDRRWQVVVLDVGVDTTTPAGELLVGVMAQFAQFERRIISARTREALAVRRAQGVHLGRRSMLPQLVVDRIVRAREHGLTLRAIAEELNEDGVATGQGAPAWQPSTVRNVLKRAT